MRVFVNTFGADIKLREEVSLQPASPSLRDVLSALRAQYRASLERFVKEDLTPVEGSAILVNGRNVLFLGSVLDDSPGWRRIDLHGDGCGRLTMRALCPVGRSRPSER